MKAQALALKTDIGLIQGRKEDAASFARDSFAAIPQSQRALGDGRVAFQHRQGGRGDPGTGRGPRAIEFVANVSYMLGNRSDRGAPQDVHRAIEVFSTTNIAELPLELVDPLTIGAIRAWPSPAFRGGTDYVGRPEVANLRC